MAFRVCNRFLRNSYISSRHVVSKRVPGSCLLSENSLCCPSSFVIYPVCFISSETLLNQLSKSKVIQDRILNSDLPSILPTDSSEQLSLLRKTPDQPEHSKLLRVALIGSPNAGKSTLSNQILGKQVFAVSKKAHTTRSKAAGILTEDATQIVLLDTPGLTTDVKAKRHQLEKSLLVDPWNTVKEADLIVAIVDVADKWTRSKLHSELLKCLTQNNKIPAILVLNKVDLVKSKSQLLDITAELTCGTVDNKKLPIRPAIKPPLARNKPGRKPQEVLSLDDSGLSDSGFTKEQLDAENQSGWPHFKEVFMLSSLNQEDVQTLKNYLLLAAKPAPWEYHSEVLTDQTPQQVCFNTIWGKLLEFLPLEVPYSVTFALDYWRENDKGELEIWVKIQTKKGSHTRMVIGPRGAIVSRIATEACDDLSHIFQRPVTMKIAVMLVKPGEA